MPTPTTQNPIMAERSQRLTRVYPNGDKVTFISNSPEFAREYGTVEYWQTYNSKYRFGCALFIDGECVYDGCISNDLRAKIIADETNAA
jgi:hypothetical protein